MDAVYTVALGELASKSGFGNVYIENNRNQKEKLDASILRINIEKPLDYFVF